MDPLTIAFIVTTGLNMMNQHQAGQQAAATERAIGELNALQLEQAAYQVELDKLSHINIFDMEAVNVRTVGERARSQGRVGIAGAGVVVDTGTALNWSRGLEAEIQADLNRLESNFRVEMRNLDRHQHNLMQQAVVARYMGALGAATAHMQATSGMLQTGASALSTGYALSTRTASVGGAGAAPARPPSAPPDVGPGMLR